jgi:protein TonB
MKSIVIITFLLFFNFGFKVSAQNKELISNIDTITCLTHDTTVFVNVDNEAKFQGGDLRKFAYYVMKNIHYPLEALVNKYQGKAYISFVIDWDGQMRNVTIYKSSGYKILDAEAIKVVKSSPVWTPARNNNICVPQLLILPIVFRNLGVISNKELELLNKGK